MASAQPAVEATRWELYRLLSEPLRLRLLALAAEDELAVGELAELLREGQSNVSRQVTSLRKAGLVVMRKQGTRAFVRTRERLDADPVVADGLSAGRGLCEADGSLAGVAEVVARRDEGAREYFAREHGEQRPTRELPAELPAYLTAVASVLGRWPLAIDVGTGDGSLLDAIAPLSERVLAVDREKVRLAQARARASLRGYGHVKFVCDTYDGAKLARQVALHGGADVVFASRLLHHVPKPGTALRALTKLLRPGGALVIIDYAPHEDEMLRERQADLWLGFSAAELKSLAERAGLCHAAVTPIEAGRRGDGPDRGLDWQLLTARKPEAKKKRTARS